MYKLLYFKRKLQIRDNYINSYKWSHKETKQIELTSYQRRS